MLRSRNLVNGDGKLRSQTDEKWQLMGFKVPQTAEWVRITNLKEMIRQTYKWFSDRLTLNDDDKKVREWFIQETKKYGCTHKVRFHLCFVLYIYSRFSAKDSSSFSSLWSAVTNGGSQPGSPHGPAAEYFASRFLWLAPHSHLYYCSCIILNGRR